MRRNTSVLPNIHFPLVDFTAATILDKFQNATAAQAVERVLKKMATVDAATILQVSRVLGGFLLFTLVLLLVFWFSGTLL